MTTPRRFDPSAQFNITVQPHPEGGWIVCDPSGGAPREEQNIVLMRDDDRIGYQAPKRHVTDAELLVLMRQLVASPPKAEAVTRAAVPKGAGLDFQNRAYANLHTAAPRA